MDVHKTVATASSIQRFSTYDPDLNRCLGRKACLRLHFATLL